MSALGNKKSPTPDVVNIDTISPSHMTLRSVFKLREDNHSVGVIFLDWIRAL